MAVKSAAKPNFLCLCRSNLHKVKGSPVTSCVEYFTTILPSGAQTTWLQN